MHRHLPINCRLCKQVCLCACACTIVCEQISNQIQSNMSSRDYHAHISRVHRTPSVLTDVPQYPNAHLVFNKKQVIYEDDEGSQRRGYYNPETRERVEVIENQQTTEVINGNGEVVYEENVDVDTEQYSTRRNRGGFNLHKWKTFRE